jgi:3D (Asp-Asp-Asp) domain-containing protein
MLIMAWQPEEFTEEPTEVTSDVIIKWKEPETSVESLEVDVVTAPELTYLGKFRLTAYCSCSKCCGKWAANRPVDDYGNELVLGSSGTILTAGYSIAVDPEVIPYGSIVVINGKEYKAQDSGGAIKGNSIDIYHSDHEAAKEFGVQYADVYLKEGVEHGK